MRSSLPDGTPGRDLRDPKRLGEALEILRQKHPEISMPALVNIVRDIDVPNYDAEHIGPIEKYGDPRTLPTTMP